MLALVFTFLDVLRWLRSLFQALFYAAGLAHFLWSRSTGDNIFQLPLAGKRFNAVLTLEGQFSFQHFTSTCCSIPAVLWWEAGDTGTLWSPRVWTASLLLPFGFRICLWFSKIGLHCFLVWASEFLSLKFIEFPGYIYIYDFYQIWKILAFISSNIWCSVSLPLDPLCVCAGLLMAFHGSVRLW